jgi:DNA-nicking Smr family endonuclease
MDLRKMAAMPYRGGPPGPEDDSDDLYELDLHGKSPEDALRMLSRELHSARVLGRGWVRVVTGRGLGNARQEPILRERVAAWLRGPEGARYGAVDVQVEMRTGGGSLLVRLRWGSGNRGG